MSIVITGNPGVGKHTIGEKISEIVNLSIIDINKIAKDSDLLQKNDETNDVEIKELERILEANISKNSIIIGHLAPYVLKKNQVKIVIILRRNPYDLISIYKERKYSDKKSIENTGSEILGVIAHDSINEFQEKTVQINVSEKTISEVVNNVVMAIKNDYASDEVDWLDLVTKNNDLRKFFVD